MDTKLVILFLSGLIFTVYFISVFTDKTEHFNSTEDNLKNLNNKMNMNQSKLQLQLQTFLKEKNNNNESEPNTSKPSLPARQEHFNYTPKRQSSYERFQASGDDIDKMVNTLEEVENVCRRFEQKVNERDEETAEKIRNNMREQLEKEDEKIQELEELVNVFRQQYLMKESINYRCTKEKTDQIDDTVKNLKENSELYRDYSQELNINIDKPISNALVNSLKDYKSKTKNKKKTKYLATETDSEIDHDGK